VAESSHLHSDSFSDHLHENVAWDTDNQEIAGTVGFDYDSIDRNAFNVEPDDERDAVVSFADMSAALSLIIQFAVASPNLKHVGSRIAAIGVLLDPSNMPFNRRTLSDIARECGITRAAVSRWICDFRDQIGTSLTVGKRSSASTKDRAGQIEAMERKTHSSFVRKDKQKQAA
jgi:hypothetical protein